MDGSGVFPLKCQPVPQASRQEQEHLDRILRAAEGIRPRDEVDTEEAARRASLSVTHKTCNKWLVPSQETRNEARCRRTLWGKRTRYGRGRLSRKTSRDGSGDNQRNENPGPLRISQWQRQ